MSNQKYTPPQYGLEAFHCPHPGCGVYAAQIWTSEFNAFVRQGGVGVLFIDKAPGREEKIHFNFSLCQSCKDYSVWADRNLVYPQRNTVPLANEDLPEEVKKLYGEAATVVQFSSRASAALLRVALQQLCKDLGGEGKSIFVDMKKFIEEGKLTQDTASVMDSIRKVGNEAAHPGQINFNERPEIAPALFRLINYVAQQMITMPRQAKDDRDQLESALESAKQPEKK